MKCFDCGDDGHIAANCPNSAVDASGKPPWCGVCNERTRLLGFDEVHRCQVCHPLRHKQLRQFRKCPSCHVTVYEWDNKPCGDHQSPLRTDSRPEREHIDAVMAANSGEGK